MPTAVYALSIHADYRCRHSGACCTAGWRIPVDAACERGLAEAAGRGQLPPAELQRRASLAVLPLTAAGSCVFHRAGATGAGCHLTRFAEKIPNASDDAASQSAGDTVRPSGRCAVHAELGHEALPLACRQFPRVSLTDSRGTFVTLSHFCPTAAAQLFRNDQALGIVQNPAAFPPGAEYVGLDAGDALPPLLRPGMLTDVAGFARWEEAAIAVLADASSAEEGLGLVALMTERVHGWRPGDGSLSDCVDRAAAACRAEPGLHRNNLAGRASRTNTTDQGGGDRLQAHLALANACLPEGFTPRVLPLDHAAVDAELVAPVWTSFNQPVRRYLAARLFGSWLAYQGRGLRTMVRGLEVSSTVLRLECIRACGAARRRLDRELFTTAVRESDRLLVHEMSSLAFARRLSVMESRPLVRSPADRAGRRPVHV